MISKCPRCDALVPRLTINGVDASEVLGSKTFRAITLNCPMCNAVLGAQIDPIAIRTDTLREIRKLLGR